METTQATPGVGTAPPQQPVVGKAVLVTYFGGDHVLKSAVATVLAISGTANELATEDGLPAITVAYAPDPADQVKMGSPRWADAFVRQSGVVHFSHNLAKAGKVAIVWGYPVQEGELPAMIQPEGNGENPIFTRQQLPEHTQPDMSQVAAVQHGKAPGGVSVSPLTSDAGKPTAADLDATAAEQAAAAVTTGEPKTTSPTTTPAEPTGGAATETPQS